VAADRRHRLTVVSGPSRGGKSRWAEHLAATSGLEVIYLATGPQLPDDPQWQQRLQRHRQRRPQHWQCREVAGALAEALEPLHEDQLALVDSIGTWVAAHLGLERAQWCDRCEVLLAALHACRGSVVLVCEETGWGVVPATEAGSRFRDRLGQLQQQLLIDSDAAWLVLQGRAVNLLSLSEPVPPES
jgi:adenosylcobinamide kinase/adenosylcobinamide-phosphate guanylyltransferase